MPVTPGKELVWVPRKAPRAPQDWRSRLKRRRDASERLPVLDCGHPDPWTCQHASDATLTDCEVDAYIATAELLFASGLCPAPRLPEMRAMWRRKGDAQRLARRIASQWQVIA